MTLTMDWILALVSWLVPKQIAANNQVALPTVRTQVAAVYRKLGIQRAAELTALLATGQFATLR
jgi:DNA-binding CsgD family transcriptional regulator